MSDLTNQRFGRIVALRDVGTGPTGRRWLCRCDCGKEFERAAGQLRRQANNGVTQMCLGCNQAQRQERAKRFKRFGARRRKDQLTRTGSLWAAAEIQDLDEVLA